MLRIIAHVISIPASCIFMGCIFISDSLNNSNFSQASKKSSSNLSKSTRSELAEIRGAGFDWSSFLAWFFSYSCSSNYLRAVSSRIVFKSLFYNLAKFEIFGAGFNSDLRSSRIYFSFSCLFYLLTYLGSWSNFLSKFLDFSDT